MRTSLINDVGYIVGRFFVRARNLGRQLLYIVCLLSWKVQGYDPRCKNKISTEISFYWVLKVRLQEHKGIVNLGPKKSEKSIQVKPVLEGLLHQMLQILWQLVQTTHLVGWQGHVWNERKEEKRSASLSNEVISLSMAIFHFRAYFAR